MNRAAEDLLQANMALKRADQLVPRHRATLHFARHRAALQYLASIDGRPRPEYLNGGQKDAGWADHCLRDFYREAIRFARRSPYLQRTLGGGGDVCQHDRGTSRLYVNKYHVFAASIFLDVSGPQGRGMLLVDIAENHKRRPPVDLFATLPRSPDYPFTIRAPDWTADDGSRTKLSAQSGEPYK